MQYDYSTMTDEEMNSLLLELGKMTHYRAVLRYLKQRDNLVVSSLRSVDPFKNPTDLARNQGIFQGLWDLTGAIQILQTAEEEAEKAGKEEDGQA